MTTTRVSELKGDQRLDKEVADDSRGVRLDPGTFRECRSERSASFKRLLKVAEAMAVHPEASVPQATGNWGDAKAAYRLLNEPDVTPDAIQRPHRRLIAQQCAEQHPLVLVLQDASDLDFTFHNKMKNRGKIGDGRGRGLIQQTALAVEPEHGQAIGLLDQSWHERVERDEAETAEQRLSRWRESDIWSDTIGRIGRAPAGCRYLHVADSHGDCFNTFAAARREGAGVLVRVMHYDRKLADGTSLAERLSARPAIGTLEVLLHEQRNGRNQIKHAERTACLEARVASVTLPPTDATRGPEGPITLNAVLLREIDPPEGVEPVRWMLLTTLAAESMEQVRQVCGYYALRWRIEEFHRVEKEGCKVEDAQFDDTADVMRLAAIKSVIAVRMLQLRDAAQAAMRQQEQEQPAQTNKKTKDQTPAATPLDTPRRLREIVPDSWIQVVAKLARLDPAKLTVSQFYRRIAMRGGWLGRKSDGPPGWKTLWRGWSELWWVVLGYELAQARGKRCG